MPDDASLQPRDYRETVFLPATSFPMRAGLPDLEPRVLETWASLYREIRAARQQAGAPLFVLHDGPPYANGAIHIGHALNKLLKDFVVRSRFALGFDVDYVPGWDCHGLPIEWKIEEEFRKEGRRKDEVSKGAFRSRCRSYAAEWINQQSREFQRLGVLADWQHRYATMDFTAEAAIVAEFHKFVAEGRVYRGSKPVMWSPVERTALADAEVEYHEHVSPTIWVRFPVIDGPIDCEGTDVVIWTTTPWTIPANRAIAFNPSISYSVYRIDEIETGLAFEPWVTPGDRLVLADALATQVLGGDAGGAGVEVALHRLDAAQREHEGPGCVRPVGAHGAVGGDPRRRIDLARRAQPDLVAQTGPDQRVTHQGQAILQGRAETVGQLQRRGARAAFAAVDDDVVEQYAGLEHGLHDGEDLVRVADAQLDPHRLSAGQLTQLGDKGHHLARGGKG